MKAQFILSILSAAAVLAAPIRRDEGKNVCKVHVATQKHVTVVHTFYSSASVAPASSAAPSTTSAFSSSSVTSISSSVPSVAAVVSAPSSSAVAAPAVTEASSLSPSPSVQEEAVIESPKVKEVAAPTSAAPIVTPTPAPEPVAPITTAAPLTTAAPVVYVAPTPTTAYVAPAVTEAAKIEAAPVVENRVAAAASTGSYEHTGEATFYDPDLGACGTNNSGTEMVAAISQNLFDLTTPNGNPNKNPVCGRKARCRVKGGKEFFVTIVDRCVGCATGDIDFSPAAFRASGAQESEGRVKVEWSLV